jgi:uncharacterized protein
MQSKTQLQNFVMGLLKNNLPGTLYYHNYQHTLYVQEKAIDIAIHEHCTAAEIEWLSAAALFHDAGYIHTYNNHEEEGCKLAMQYLPAYGFTNEAIENICGMIMATKMPQSPKNKLEEILADADLEYLGTADAAIIAGNLYNELHHLNPALSSEEWKKMQIAFLQTHHYFTAFCKEHKEPAKQAYLHSLLTD